MLHLNGQTMTHSISSIAPFGLREHTGSRLVRHTGREALVEGPCVPFDLGVRVFNVFVGENDSGERGVGRVGDEAIDSIREPGVGPFEDIRQMPPLVPFLALLIDLDIATSGTEDTGGGEIIMINKV